MHGKNRQRKHRQWKDIPARQKRRMASIGIVNVALTGFALWDLSHRPASQVKGKKFVWALVSFVQPVGPVIYLLFGRKRLAAS
jgi:hypothetical protein